MWINYIGDNFWWFWSRQWDTHGTCSYPRYNQYRFFALALRIYFKHPLFTILTNLQITPGPTARYVTKTVAYKLKREIGVLPQLNCFNGHLIEIGICLDVNGNEIDCISFSSSCGIQFYWWAPP